MFIDFKHLDLIDSVLQNMCKTYLNIFEASIEQSLSSIDTFHTILTLYQQEIEDIASGEITFSKKYLN